MTRILFFLFAFCFALNCLSAPQSSAYAIIRLLNSRTSGSPKAYIDAARIVAQDAAAGRPVQQYVMAIVCDDRQLPEELRLSSETRQKYLESSRKRIRELAEFKNNALAWYLLSIEKNDVGMLERAAKGQNVQALNAWGSYTLSTTMADPDATNAMRQKAAETAFNCYLKASEQDDANGFFNLGICYKNGFGCAKDEIKAFGCFRRAAEAGHPEAMNNLGGCYRDGVAVERNLKTAASWFKKSSDCENAYGQLNLAVCYLEGDGVEKDPARAVKLLNLAVQQGNVEALDVLGMCYFKGNGIQKNELKAFDYFKLAAEHGLPQAMENLASCYEQGLGGVEKNQVLSTVWKIRSRAVRGDRNAAAWLLQNGYSVR